MNLLETLNIGNIDCNLNAVEWHVNNATAAIYDPVTDDMIKWAENEIQKDFPVELKSILKSTNGLFLKKLNIFGIPPSLFMGKGLNRLQLEPLSIIEANKFWYINYTLLENTIMVGAVEGWSENTGLFMQQDGLIIKVTNEGVSEPFELTDKLINMANDA